MAVAASEVCSNRHWATSTNPNAAVEDMSVVVVVGAFISLLFLSCLVERYVYSEDHGTELYTPSFRGKLSGIRERRTVDEPGERPRERARRAEGTRAHASARVHFAINLFGDAERRFWNDTKVKTISSEV